jgi:ActR/RegA family two-component response regulator
VESGTDSSRKRELATALHRLRSTLARLKAELELAEVDGTLPPVDRLLADLDEAFALLAAAEMTNHATGSVPVLVLDDDERLAEITARGLRRLGYEADSSSVLRPLGADEVLIFDLSLFSGLDAGAQRAVRAAKPIVVTGGTDPASRSLASSLGATDYLVKPIELDELAAAINRRMGKRDGETPPRRLPL